MMREHLPPGKETAANTVNYTFSNTGPEFPSVVPDKASSWYVGRFIDSQMMADAIKRIDKCADAAALATETTVQKEYIAATHEMIPNTVAARTGRKNLLEFGVPEFTEEEREFLYAMQDSAGQERFEIGSDVKPYEETWMSVTDSSEYSWFAPLSLLHVALGPGPGWHNWMVTACAGRSHGVKAVNAAARAVAATAVDFILDARLLAEAREDQKKRLNGRTYAPIFPEGTPVPLSINSVIMEKYRSMRDRQPENVASG
jgi:aminobenzoyl-glutamate utilization protein B